MKCIGSVTRSSESCRTECGSFVTIVEWCDGKPNFLMDKIFGERGGTDNVKPKIRGVSQE
jgi:hypothetical protein